jgi:uncharacterized protein (TIGR04222 family)
MTNPLNLSGPQFLSFYLWSFLAATCGGLLLRTMLRRDASAENFGEPQLDAIDVAYLAGGSGRAVQAAIVSLVQQDCLRFRSSSDIHAVTGCPRRPSLLERVVHSTAGKMEDGTTLFRIHRAASVVTRDIDDRLVSCGLLMPGGMRRLLALVTLGPPATIMLLGVAKFLVGISRDRPVGLLTLMLLASVAGLALLLCLQPRTTAAGAALVRRQRALNDDARHHAYRFAGPELTLAVALFGPALLAGVRDPQLQGLARQLAPASGGSWDASSSSCGGSSCGASCGGGGGGCGGGGCGGCSG